MSERPQLRALAERAGIESSYAAYDGREQRASDATLEALLLALGFDASSEERAEQDLHALEREAQSPGLVPVRVVRAGASEAAQVELKLPAGISGTLRYRLELALEQGGTHVLEGQLSAESPTFVTGIPGSSELVVGYHELRCLLEIDGTQHHSTQDLIVAPLTCLELFEQVGDRRVAGIWSHIYSLHSERSRGIGDLSDLRTLCVWAAEHGVELVGINPLHAVDNLEREVSPYYPLSRVYRNPIYLDVDAVVAHVGSSEVEAELRSPAAQAQQAELRAHARVDYAAVYAHKRTLLDAAHRAFMREHKWRDTELGRAYAAYRSREGQALRDFATFCALRERLRAIDPHNADFRSWPAAYRDVRSAEVAAFAREQAPAVDLHAYLQFELEAQLHTCERAARGSGMPIGLYGDLALGDAPFASEVWAQPELYAHGASIGAPPDPYSDSGQNWGLIPINPLALRRTRYHAFRALLRGAFRHLGALRIDHVMGLSRQFFVPAGRDTREGGYVRFPLADLLGILALESRRARALVVGEDLGVVPDGLRERMAQNGILRSQVLYFERASPRQYARSALATIGTHDLPPFFGFWSGLDLDLRRRAGNIADDQALARAREERAGMKAHLLWLLRQEGLVPDEPSEPSPQSVCVALQFLLAGAASCAIAVALDDLTLEYQPLNVPAASLPDAPNWSRRSRLSLEQIVSNDRIRDLLYSITQRVRGRNPY